MIIVKKPKIRFKGFTETWEQRKLEDFGVATGGTSIESEFIEDGKYKVISIGSYSECSKYVDQGIRTEKTPKTKNRILNKNDLAMILNDKTSSGKIIGRVLLIDADDAYVYNQRTERIEVNHNCYVSEFLYHLLNADNIRAKIIRTAQGNTQIYVNWNVIKNFTYDIPINICEQIVIGDCFSKLDDLITLHQRKCENLKKLKKFMLQKMFPQNGENVPKIRFYNFTDTWEQRKLGSICKITMGQSPNGSTYSETPCDYILVQGNADLKDGWVVPRIWTSQITKTAKSGDLIMSVRAPAGAIGKTAYDVVIGRGVASINGNEFIYQTLKKYEIEGYWRKIATGSTFKSINSEDINDTILFVPIDDSEQKQIGSLFSKLDNLITLHQSKCDNLKELKKYMLQNMFI